VAPTSGIAAAKRGTPSLSALVPGDDILSIFAKAILQ